MRILVCLLFSIVAVDFATAGCRINLSVKNETEYLITVKYDPSARSVVIAASSGDDRERHNRGRE